MERRYIRIAVLVLTAIVLLSALLESDAFNDWCYPDETTETSLP